MKHPLRAIGPAIIVAAVVLGPGSITTSTKVGASFGYDALWILAVLLALLIGVASLAAWLGATLERPLCRELNRALGPWAGGCIGVAFFLIVAGFQSSNNMAVIAGLEPLLGEGRTLPAWAIIAILGVVNALILLLLYRSRDLYRQIERIMKGFVLLMILAFLVNFLWARPSPGGIAAGLVPALSLFAEAERALVVMGLIATTFSVAGAFYQGYLVRERGWGPQEVRAGFADSVVGMGILVAVTGVILATSAATFHGEVAPDDLGDAGSMARQLEAAFGPLAGLIFCGGFLAGAFSSFLVNAMIGGHVFADGLGLASRLDEGATRHATAAALLVGMAVGILALTTGFDRTTTIVIAQASTVIGGPAVVAGLLYLGIRARRRGDRPPPAWMLVLTGLGLAVSIAVAIRTALGIAPKIVAWFPA